MALGERTGCHQMPERSFFYKGYQMPICARCTGVLIGYLLAVPGYIIFGFHSVFSIFSCICMITDWVIQACKIKSSTNHRRLITGILGGYGIMTLQIGVIKKLIFMLK
ncbi:DUF2085 domain-containing protein [Anaerocolumna sedimenticola]|uniref:DUF2085 domain-containing protein n=2 Tax=Anaerocolumna sedimenticola TaxID=2696063 RepID=A0A6P1TU12_9FIRM|nr:DUF2085 domain-containing protein [Anaerocolumna sedimenticola]